jgi:hypothetical protein
MTTQVFYLYHKVQIPSLGAPARRMEVSHAMKLKEARTQAGYGIPKATRLCDMDPAGFKQIERGSREPGIETVVRISRGLGLADPWQIDEFVPALKRAEALGIVVRPDAHGKAE